MQPAICEWPCVSGYWHNLHCGVQSPSFLSCAAAWCYAASTLFPLPAPSHFLTLSKSPPLTQVAKRQDPVALEQTIARIKAGMDERGVAYEDISGRPKNLYGIWLKMKTSGITDLSQIYDVTALRVVVTNKHDCYQALRVVQEAYRNMPERSKDYIKEERKANGYQSLHETVYGEGGLPVEVQIRTHKMHVSWDQCALPGLATGTQRSRQRDAWLLVL